MRGICGIDTVFLSPHDDDLAFSIGGALISGYITTGVVATIFSVSNSTIDEQERNVCCVTAARRKENGRFYSSLSAELEIIYLDRLDAPLRLGVSEERVIENVQNASDHIEANHISSVIESLLKPSSMLFAPLGLGGHIDHLLVHKVACAFAKNGRAIAFYEDLPYAARLSVSDIEKIVKKTQVMIGQELRILDILTCLNASLKRKALSVYKTQISQGILDEIVRYGMSFHKSRIVERLWCNSIALNNMI